MTTTPSLRERFIALDDQLAALAVPPCTTWWREQICAWLDRYEREGVIEFLACAGRGSAKSTVLYKLALLFTLAGDFTIPVGEVHYAVILSRIVEEAKKGVQIIARWLTLLGIPHHIAGDVVELDGVPRGIRVVAASVAAASGWRAYFVAKDERSKWPMAGVDEREAEEVDTSAMAMTATHDQAPKVGAGSAWGDFGGFYDAVMAGSNAERSVAGPVPTWIAAPHITKESTQKKEKDPKRWAREYACVFQAGASSALDPDEVRAALRQYRPGCALSAPVIGFDSSMGRGDAAAWLCAIWLQPVVDEDDEWERDAEAEAEIGGAARIYKTLENGLRVRKVGPAPEPPKPELVVFNVGAITGKFAAQGITSDHVVAMVAEAAKRQGAQHVLADHFQSFALAAAFAKHGLAYVGQTWTVETKAEALLRLRTWLRDGTLAIEPTPEGQELVRELLNLQETIRVSGSIGLGARRGHDDRAAALLSIAMADSQGFMSGGPVAAPTGMVVDSPVRGRSYHGGAAPPV